MTGYTIEGVGLSKGYHNKHVLLFRTRTTGVHTIDWCLDDGVGVGRNDKPCTVYPSRFLSTTPQRLLQSGACDAKSQPISMIWRRTMIHCSIVDVEATGMMVDVNNFQDASLCIYCNEQQIYDQTLPKFHNAYST